MQKKTLYLVCFLYTTCLTLSHAKYNATGKGIQRKSSASLDRLRRLANEKATIKLIEPYTQISEEDAVRRLIQEGGSLEDVVDLSLEYQQADETMRRLQEERRRLGPAGFLIHHIPTVQKAITDGLSYVVALLVEFLKTGQSIREMILQLNQLTKAEHLSWYQALASIDTSKLMSSTCGAYELNACIELMSPKKMHDTSPSYYRNTEFIQNDQKYGYSAYFGAHACTGSTLGSIKLYLATGCSTSSFGSCDATIDPTVIGSSNTEFDTAKNAWIAAATGGTTATAMRISWDTEGETVKECNEYFKYTCLNEERTTSSNDVVLDRTCSASIMRGTSTLTGTTAASHPTADTDAATFTYNTAAVSTRNKYTMLVYDTGDDKRGRVYAQCDTKTIEMYERIKHQLFADDFVSTSECPTEIYKDGAFDLPVW